jgi:hypothetical protein
MKHRLHSCLKVIALKKGSDGIMVRGRGRGHRVIPLYVRMSVPSKRKEDKGPLGPHWRTNSLFSFSISFSGGFEQSTIKEDYTYGVLAKGWIMGVDKVAISFW